MIFAVTRNPRGERALPCIIDEGFVAAFSCEYGCDRVVAYRVIDNGDGCVVVGVVYRVAYVDSFCENPPRLLLEGCLVGGTGSVVEKLRGVSADDVLEAVIEPGFAAALVDCGAHGVLVEKSGSCNSVSCFENLSDFLNHVPCRFPG